MKYTAKRFTADDRKAVAEFLALPKRLYSGKELMQDRKEEEALIRGTHILSGYFRVFPMIVTDGHGHTAARCVVTIYPDRSCAYFGFFECEDDAGAARVLFECAEAVAAEQGKDSLTGPVDCSFWIRYRLKTNNFGCPYTGEPYNNAYYERLLKECGFDVCGEYISNRFGRIPEEYGSGRYSKRLPQFIKKGYELRSTTDETFDRCLKEVYSLLIEVYSDFQTYSRITEEEFIQMYSPLKRIIDHSMVKMAYYKGEPVGFFVSVPDFGNAVRGSITPAKLLRILKTKKRCSQYILLYLGIRPEHKGLGRALADILCQTLADNQASSVGALIRAGKVNGSYFRELIEGQYEYRLYSKGVAA